MLFKVCEEHSFLQGQPNLLGEIGGLLEQWFATLFSSRTTVTNKKIHAYQQVLKVLIHLFF